MKGIENYRICDSIYHHLRIKRCWWETNFYVYFDEDIIADLIIKYIPDQSLNLEGVIDFTKIRICQPYSQYRFMIQFIDDEGGYYDDTAFDKQTLINFLFDGLKHKIIYFKK